MNRKATLCWLAVKVVPVKQKPQSYLWDILLLLVERLDREREPLNRKFWSLILFLKLLEMPKQLGTITQGNIFEDIALYFIFICQLNFWAPNEENI